MFKFNFSNIILHPLFIWAIVWATAILLYMQEYSELLHPLNANLYFTILFIFAGSLLTVLIHQAAIGFRLIKIDNHYFQDSTSVNLLLHYLFFISILMYIGYVIEIFISGGFPLLFILKGMSIQSSYKEFGLKGLHGFLNSIYFVVTTGILLIYLRSGKRKLLIYYFILLMLPFIFVTRQALIVILLQSFIIYFLNRPFQLKHFLNITVITFINVVIFGLVGAIRTGTEAFMTLARMNRDWPDWLPSGFAWVYIYITTPILNLDNTIQFFKPIYNIYFTLYDILPSPIRKQIFKETEKVGVLETEAFNVSSYLLGPVKDGGPIAAVLYGIILFIITYIFYLKAIKSKDYISQLSFCVLAQCMFISIFYNHFLSLPVAMQFFWIWCYKFYPGFIKTITIPKITLYS